MSPAILLAFLISLSAIPFASVRMTAGRLLLALTLTTVHVAASITYFWYAQNNPADTALYYFDWPQYASDDFAMGTVFVLKLVQLLKTSLGATYLDCFLIFQSVGLWGVICLMRTLEEIHIMAKIKRTTLSDYLLFLPSLHFWTSGIGKDAPLFFAVSVCTWALINPSKRSFAFIFAIAVMVLFRAHIALVAMASLSAAAFFHRQIRPDTKIALLIINLAAVAVLIGTVNTTLRVNVASTSSVSSFLNKQTDIADSSEGDTSVSNVPFILRFFSLLFRPLFYDANGVFGLIASFENIGSLLLFAYLLKNRRVLRRAMQHSLFVRYSFLFAFMLLILLAVIYYNVGLGIRQRVMAFPSVLSIFVAVRAMRLQYAQILLNERAVRSRGNMTA